MTNFFKTIRNLPKNINPNEMYLFEHELKRIFPKSEQLNLKNFLLDSNGTFITTKNLEKRIIEKSSIYEISKIKFILLIIKKILVLNFKIILRKTVWFTDNWSNGYFHWMLDALPRLQEASIKNSKLKIVLPQQFNNQEYIKQSLNALGFDNLQFMKSNYLYLFHKLLFQTHSAPTGNYHDATILGMRNTIIENCRTDICFKGHRIYVSRSKASRRKVLNESELMPTMEKYGFSIVYFEDYSWHEQVSICANANVMMGLHGAGLTNMLFMPNQSKIIELRMKGDEHNNCYFSLASALNLNYYYITCEANKNKMLEADFYVDIQKIENLLTVIEYE